MLLVEEGEKVEAVHPRRPLLRETARDVHVRAVPDRDVVVERAVEEELAREEPVHRLARPRRVDALRDDGALQPRPRQRAALPVGRRVEEAAAAIASALHRRAAARPRGVSPPPASAGARRRRRRPPRTASEKAANDLVEPPRARPGRGSPRRRRASARSATHQNPARRGAAGRGAAAARTGGRALARRSVASALLVDAAEPAVRHDRLHRAVGATVARPSPRRVGGR